MFNSTLSYLTDEERQTRLGPSQNILAFTAWHMPRVQYNTIQIWIQGKPEIFHAERWDPWRSLQEFGSGTGILLTDADSIARRVDKQSVAEFASQVHQEAVIWLGSITPNNWMRFLNQGNIWLIYRNIKLPALKSRQGTSSDNPPGTS